MIYPTGNMTDVPHSDSPVRSIPARSRRQAMDWSLVLASQEIAAIIQPTGDGWELLIDAPEFGRAEAALRQYEIENRGWRWRQEWLGPETVFHGGAALWAAAMAGFYYWTMVRYPGLKSDGMVDSQAIAHGQWWRVFTAVTLHENLSHLASNAGIGFLLLGLAMPRFGPGITLIAAYLAGVAGNCAGVLLQPEDYYSLGASGMVTGALGMLMMTSVTPWKRDRMSGPWLPRSIAAGVLLLVLIGFSPGSDQLAHIGGFVAGAAFGLTLGWIKPARLRRPLPNVLATMALAAVVLGTWVLAVRH
jgi:membrane associated rhomboid family serine protease